MAGASDSRAAYGALTPGDFPFRPEVPARFSDLDMLRHINNVAVAEIIAEGRNQFVMELSRRASRPEGCRFMVVQSAISYISEAHYPATFVIGTGVLAIGRSSVRLAQAFFEADRCTSAAETILVATRGRDPLVIEQPLREALASLSIAPELFPSQLQTC